MKSESMFLSFKGQQSFCFVFPYWSALNSERLPLSSQSKKKPNQNKTKQQQQKKKHTQKNSFLVKCVCAESLSHLWLYATPGSFVHGNSPGKNTGVDGHAFLQGIFTTQGSNPGPPHCRWILYCLSHQEAPVLSK